MCAFSLDWIIFEGRNTVLKQLLPLALAVWVDQFISQKAILFPEPSLSWLKEIMLRFFSKHFSSRYTQAFCLVCCVCHECPKDWKWIFPYNTTDLFFYSRGLTILFENVLQKRRNSSCKYVRQQYLQASGQSPTTVVQLYQFSLINGWQQNPCWILTQSQIYGNLYKLFSFLQVSFLLISFSLFFKVFSWGDGCCCRV